MTLLVNHLKNQEAQRKTLSIASGRHDVDGDLIWSKTEGVTPNHNIYVRQALAKGDWEGPEGVWYKGLNVPATDYDFQDGSQIAPGTFFPTDLSPHTGTVILDVKAPTGVGDADTKTTTPELARTIVKTEKFPDFDAGGNQVDPSDGITIVVSYFDLLGGEPLDKTFFTYTASSARVVVGWMFKYGKIAFWRINWAKWVSWRDYCASLETVDYTTIADFEGIGLSAEYYSGTNFDTLLWKRIDPVIEFANTTGTPAVGLPLDSFSVKWLGRIKAKYSETYTFKITADNGARLWVNGVKLIDEWDDTGTHTPGTYSQTIALTAGEFYDIEVNWNEGIANAEFSLKWSSALQTEVVIPMEALYPLAQEQPRYEAHVSFSAPTTLDAMKSAVLMVSNSIVQDVDGKLEFYCVEQLTPTFAFTETNGTILDNGSFKFYRSDVRVKELQNVWEASFGDLDSQYLEQSLKPIAIKLPDLIESAGREIYGSVIDLYNMTRWQARKVLAYIVDRAVVKDLFSDFDGSALAYQVIAGDLVTLSSELGNFSAKPFIVIEASDLSPEETADIRKFVLQEW